MKKQPTFGKKKESPKIKRFDSKGNELKIGNFVWATIEGFIRKGVVKQLDDECLVTLEYIAQKDESIILINMRCSYDFLDPRNKGEIRFDRKFKK